ncbi:MAG: outer membrane lipoprotein carrier protein LolA [Flavobacteriales bacterium]|nr:outer membrane lipoprotein carrier protein LolA [Flavobacteriales bacterium]
MKRKSIITLSLAVVFLASITTLIAQDATATKILDGVSKTYQAYKTIKAGFTIKVQNGQNNSAISESGTLYLKAKKFKIELSDQEIYCDGKTMWTYLKDENECQITDYDANAQEINPADIFTIYKTGFLSKYTGEEISGGKKVQKIELTPTNKNKPYFKVKLDIEKASNKIMKMSVLNKNGINSTYNVTSFTPNLEMADAVFKFDPRKKPGVVITDLRKQK